MGTLKMIAYPFGIAIAAMLAVELIAMALFGSNNAEWREWQNQFVSVCGTVAGGLGFIAGLQLAVCSQIREGH